MAPTGTLPSHHNKLSHDSEPADARGPARGDIGDILAFGLGMSTIMWVEGYLLRMPGDRLPGSLILITALVSLCLMGAWAGYATRRGPWAGLWAGMIAGGLNLLLLGALGHDLTNDHRIIDYTAVWAPISVLACGFIGWLGALAGSRFNPQRSGRIYGRSAVPIATAAATLALVMAGGMVTGMNAGLSVPDWPDSFKFGMFLFPLARMTGGIYFEHTHRLLGTLVGLATLIQAIYLVLRDRRGWLKALAITALLMVIIQGVMGGLRVTGHFTDHHSRPYMDPSTTLAIVHGVFGQLFLGFLVAIAVFCTRSWQSNLERVARPGYKTDAWLTASLVAALALQLVLGSVLRHVGQVLFEHISMATIILFLAVFAGVRAWGMNQDDPILRRLGAALLLVVMLQVLLGVAAVAALGGGQPVKTPNMVQAVITTAHQTVGAILLCVALALALWTRRLRKAPQE